MYCRMLSSITGLYLIDVSSTPLSHNNRKYLQTLPSVLWWSGQPQFEDCPSPRSMRTGLGDCLQILPEGDGTEADLVDSVSRSWSDRKERGREMILQAEHQLHIRRGKEDEGVEVMDGVAMGKD